MLISVDDRYIRLLNTCYEANEDQECVIYWLILRLQYNYIYFKFQGYDTIIMGLEYYYELISWLQ